MGARALRAKVNRPAHSPLHRAQGAWRPTSLHHLVAASAKSHLNLWRAQRPPIRPRRPARRPALRRTVWIVQGFAIE